MYKCQVRELISYTKAYQTNGIIHAVFLFSDDNKPECVFFFIYRIERVPHCIPTF